MNNGNKMTQSITKDFRLLTPASQVYSDIEYGSVKTINEIQDKLIRNNQYGEAKVFHHIAPQYRRLVLNGLRMWAELQNYSIAFKGNGDETSIHIKVKDRSIILRAVKWCVRKLFLASLFVIPVLSFCGFYFGAGNDDIIGATAVLTCLSILPLVLFYHLRRFI